MSLPRSGSRSRLVTANCLWRRDWRQLQRHRAAPCELPSAVGQCSTLARWSVKFSSSASTSRPTIRLDLAGSGIPQPASGGEGASAVTSWAMKQEGIRVSQTRPAPRRRVCRGASVRGRRGADIGPVAAALRITSVVNIFVYGRHFEVWCARPSTVAGNLQHLLQPGRWCTRCPNTPTTCRQAAPVDPRPA